MKKLSILLFLLCMVAIGAIKKHSSHQDKVNPLLLYNIEALAADEIMRPVHCFGRGSIDCPASDDKVDYVAEGYSLKKWR